MTPVLFLCSLSAAAGLLLWLVVWLAASPARMLAAGAAMAAAHPTLTLTVTAAATAVVLAAAVVVVWRALADAGWLLIGIQDRSACAPVGVRHG
jgi:hypothetical protein